MSLSLLKAYDSSDDENNDAEDTSENIERSQESRSLKDDSSRTKNFLIPDSSDSENSDVEDNIQGEQDGQEVNDYPTNTFTTTSYTYDNISSSVYGPQHPSQMYNYAAYSEAYAGSSSAMPDAEDPDEPSRKRRGGPITDSEAKKLIQKYEADAMNLAVPDDLEIADVRVDSQLGNVRANLIRNITTGPVSNFDPTTVLGDGPGKCKTKDGKPVGVAKRKHQITYLAYLAKSNEETLQNEWAKNRLTKKQTQAKYGF